MVEVLPAKSVDLLTKRVLINAIHFKGKQFKQFEEKYIGEKLFKLARQGYAYLCRNCLETLGSCYGLNGVPSNLYVGDLTPRTSECDHIWRWDLETPLKR